MPYVQVYVEPSDALSDLDDDELAAILECRRSKQKRPPITTVSLEVDDLEEVSASLAIGDIEQAMLILERILPRQFRFLSLDVRRFYARTMRS